MDTDRVAATFERLADELNVVDALLFRRISTSTWAHLGGFGRGRGWAGIVDVEDAHDPLSACVPVAAGAVRRFDFDTPQRVLGPYYAASGAVVRIDNDVAVILAHPREALRWPSADAAAAGDDALRELAHVVETSVDDVLPSKRLADELEVLNAVRRLMTTPASPLTDTLQHILDVAADALSCEVGALRDGEGRLALVGLDRSGLAEWQIAAALDELQQVAGGDPCCVQDIAASPLAHVPHLAEGLRSVLALPLPEPVGGILVVAHTDAGPRGFTNLCRRLGEHVADAGSVVAQTAAMRDQLQAVADTQARAARTDNLTGLGNRLLWEEALAAADARLAAGAEIAVISVDVDGLKQVNDQHGHDAGDDLLRRCADIIRRHMRSGDAAVRLGGDEFAVLLPVSRELARARGAALMRDLAAGTSTVDTVAASVGVGSAAAGGRAVDAVRGADAQMYADKRARRAACASMLPAG